MKKISKLIRITLVQAVVFFSACTTGDELYTDPSNPAEVNAATLLTAAEVNTFMNFEGEYARVTCMFTQHQTGVSAQYLDFQNYIIGETAFTNSYRAQYETMYNIKLLWEKYGENRPYYRGIAKVLMAMNIGLTTDLYDAAPYTEAFQAPEGNFTPKYDSQSDLLNTIQKLLDEALTEFGASEDDNAEAPSSDDLIFGGVISG